MKSISQKLRDGATFLLQHGHSVKDVASQLGLGYATVWRIRKQTLPNLPTQLAGRPRILNAYQERHILRSISSGRLDTATQIQRDLKNRQGINITTQTVRNMLKRNGLKSAVKVKKPLLKAKHRKQRLEFAKKYQHWTTEDWRQVIFSDETKINRFGSDGRKWCWKIPARPLQPNHVIPTIKHGGGSLMVWGCITAQGVGYMARIDGTMDAQLYCQILEEDLLNSLTWYGLKPEEIVFQHDGDPKHTAKKTKQWLSDNGISVLDWPPQSPDLNPIENLWDRLKRRLSNYPAAPTSMKLLWERVEYEWNSITKEECVELIDSMPRRIAATLQSKGGYTDY